MLPRWAYSYTLNILNAITLSASIGTRGWNAGREKYLCSSKSACAGEIEELGISESLSMLSNVRLANECAASLRALMLSSSKGAYSSE